MNPEFEKQSLEHMLTAVRQKRQRKHGASVACFVLLMLGIFQVFRIDSPEAPNVERLLIVEEPVSVSAASYTVITTQPDMYETIDTASTTHIIVRTPSNTNYEILNQGELMARLPGNVAIRIDPDGTGALISLP